MSGKRNRIAGHGWERDLVKVFRELGYTHVVTTRSESRARDNAKVDLMNTMERKNGQFVFNVQAKNAVGHLPYGKLLAEMPVEDGIINCVLHKQTKRVNSRFVVTGKYAILDFEDFKTLIRIAVKEGLLTPELVRIYGDSSGKVEDSVVKGDSKSILYGTGIIPWGGVQNGKGMAEA